MRVERDFLGTLEVPADAYYGIHTVRAARNFPISGLRAHPQMVRAMAMIKKAAAMANSGLGRLERRKAAAIVRACDEIIAGKFAGQFIVDVFQMGAGTSFHMNMNEVLANRAAEILGGRKGDYGLVHPNDHVNFGQSTNDVYPTAMRLSVLFLLRENLIPEVRKMERALAAKAREFAQVVKSGRTHLQDAAPVKLGQEFNAYGTALSKCGNAIEAAGESLYELGIGGSAVGTGLNAAPGYREDVVSRLRKLTGLRLGPAEDLAEAMQSMRPFAEVSSALRVLAGELNRIANDIRLMSSGPRTGLAEVSLPPVAPGSSIMPGKVNPSLLEMMNMVCYQVIGCDLAVNAAAQAGQLELNVMMPVIAFNLHLMLNILTNALRQVRMRCIKGIKANPARCREYAEKTLGSATALTPRIGYARAAAVAREALKTGRTIRELLLEKGILRPGEIQELLDPASLAQPHQRNGRGQARKSEHGEPKLLPSPRPSASENQDLRAWR
jgi:aspartate ammonia-lyase